LRRFEEERELGGRKRPDLSYLLTACLWSILFMLGSVSTGERQKERRKRARAHGMKQRRARTKVKPERDIEETIKKRERQNGEKGQGVEKM
jgi:hypothetical protein